MSEQESLDQIDPKMALIQALVRQNERLTDGLLKVIEVIAERGITIPGNSKGRAAEGIQVHFEGYSPSGPQDVIDVINKKHRDDMRRATSRIV